MTGTYDGPDDYGSLESVAIHGYGMSVRRDGVDSSVSTFGGFAHHADAETEAPDRELVHRLAETADAELVDVLDG